MLQVNKTEADDSFEALSDVAIEANGTSVFNSSSQQVSIDVPLRGLLTNQSNGTFHPNSTNTALLNPLGTFPTEETYGRSTALGEIAGFLQQRLEAALLEVMKDITAFVGMAGSGVFSTTSLINVTSLENVLET